MDLNETKLSIMRRYPLETLITALFLCVSILAGVVYSNTAQIEELHDKQEKYFKEDAKILLITLEKNTEALNRLNNQNPQK